MSKHKRAGDDKEEVGKAGSTPSSTENEKAQAGRDDAERVPKISKKDVGGESGGPLH